MESIIFAILAAITTLAGGGIAFRFKSKINALIALSAGIIIATALFTLFPEGFELAGHGPVFLIAVGLGFLLLYILERFFTLHTCMEEDCDQHTHISDVSGAGLAIHGVLDGIAIGVGFIANFSLGLLIALGIILHNIGVGVSITSIMLKSKKTKHKAKFYLGLNALAPIVGVFIAKILIFSDSMLGFLLGFFAGFFIYIGSSDLLPEVHKKDSSVSITVFTILGFVIVFLLTVFLGHA